jgi:hypothetical protein
MSTGQDIKSDQKVTQSLHPAATTDGTRNGTGVDVQGYDGVGVMVHVGARTDGTHTPSLEDSADNSTFGAVAAGNLIGSFTAISGAGQQNAAQWVGYTGGKRYVRAKVVTTGSTTGAVIGASIVAGKPGTLPAGTTPV